MCVCVFVQYLSSASSFEKRLMLFPLQVLNNSFEPLPGSRLEKLHLGERWGDGVNPDVSIVFPWVLHWSFPNKNSIQSTPWSNWLSSNLSEYELCTAVSIRECRSISPRRESHGLWLEFQWFHGSCDLCDNHTHQWENDDLMLIVILFKSFEVHKPHKPCSLHK